MLEQLRSYYEKEGRKVPATYSKEKIMKRIENLKLNKIFDFHNEYNYITKIAVR